MSFTAQSSEFIEELEILNSIYGDQIKVDLQLSSTEILVQDPNDGDFYITISVPNEYPTSSYSCLAVDIYPKTLVYMQIHHCQDILKAISDDTQPGEPILFSLIESLRCHYRSGNDQESNTKTFTGAEESQFPLSPEYISEPANLSPSPSISIDSNFKAKEFRNRIIHGVITMEQKSSFQSHIAPVTSMDEVAAFRTILMEDRKIASATHNIMAFRFKCPISSIIHHDCDDDGEDAASGRLAEMMRLMGAMNVIVIVSRWYGGIKLGPARFKFICNSARDLLEQHGYCTEVKKGKKR